MHGYGHHRVYTLSPDEFRHDVQRASKVISEITHEPVMGYRAPEWSIRDDSLWALEILKQEEFATLINPMSIDKAKNTGMILSIALVNSELSED